MCKFGVLSFIHTTNVKFGITFINNGREHFQRHLIQNLMKTLMSRDVTCNIL